VKGRLTNTLRRRWSSVTGPRELQSCGAISCVAAIVGVEMLPRGLSDPDAIARAYTLSAKRCGHRICGVAARLPHPEGCRRPLRWRMASRSFRERGISYEPLLAAQRPPSPAVFISWLLIQPFLSIEEGYGIPAFVLDPHTWSAELHVRTDQTKRVGGRRHPFTRISNASPRQNYKNLRIHAPASRKAYHGKPRARRHARHNSQEPFDVLR
jgi:hypothetical protein